MARETESCPNKKCPFLKNVDDNPEGKPFTRPVNNGCKLCPHCETRVVLDK